MDISQLDLSTPVPSPKLQGCAPQKWRGCTDFPQLTWPHGLQSLRGIASHLVGTGCCHLLLLGCLHLPCEIGIGFEFIFNKLTILEVGPVIKFLAFREDICSSPCSQKYTAQSHVNTMYMWGEEISKYKEVSYCGMMCILRVSLFRVIGVRGDTQHDDTISQQL